MQKAVFLDRDGVINREVDNLKSLNQLRLLPQAASAIKKINKRGFLVIIITNQPVVARGWITENELQAIHQVLLSRLAKKGAKIDAIYYCPHHPNANVLIYRKVCADRKPGVGLVKKAAEKFKISLKNSFFIGDSTRDIQTAKNAGLKSILVKTGFGGKDKKYQVIPDFMADNLPEAVLYILKN